MDDQRLEEIAKRLVESLRELDADEYGELDRRASVPLAVAAIRDALSSQGEALRLARGAAAAQDERERVAGFVCGVPYDLHGCDWPHAVAERVQVLEEELRKVREEREMGDQRIEEIAGRDSVSVLVFDIRQMARAAVNLGRCAARDGNARTSGRIGKRARKFAAIADLIESQAEALRQLREERDRLVLERDEARRMTEERSHAFVQYPFALKRAESAEAELHRLEMEMHEVSLYLLFDVLGALGTGNTDSLMTLAKAATRHVVERFYLAVNARAEAEMLAGKPVTGAHHRALEAEIAAYRVAGQVPRKGETC